MARGGRDKDRETGPERRCIATGEVRPKAELIRFVAAPDGQIVPDVLEKLPGRGIWITADRAALELAVSRVFPSEKRTNPETTARTVATTRSSISVKPLDSSNTGGLGSDAERETEWPGGS